MKPKYILLTFKNLDGYYVIKRLSGGYISGGMTITKYEVLYPRELDRETQKRVRFEIKGDGRGTKGTIFKKSRFRDSLRGVFKDLF
jgi:hypothetical protein